MGWACAASRRCGCSFPLSSSRKGWASAWGCSNTPSGPTGSGRRLEANETMESPWQPHNGLVTTSVQERVREVVAAAPREILAVYLYGSRARGEARAASDVDVAVL